jgi:hypothetical protein
LVCAGALVLVLLSVTRDWVYLAACRLRGREVLATSSSPCGVYDVYFTRDTSHGGLGVDVYVSRWDWLLPRLAVTFIERVEYLLDGERLGALPEGLEGPISRGLVWSRGGRYVAGTADGWFTNLYDLREDRHVLWAKPPQQIIVGENPEESGELNPYYAELAAFHRKVQGLLDSDGGAVSHPGTGG